MVLDEEPPTNNLQVDGKQKVMYALTRIKGVGRRYSNLVCKKADVDLNKRYEKPKCRNAAITRHATCFDEFY